jgi:hypothetical protein
MVLVGCSNKRECAIAYSGFTKYERPERSKGHINSNTKEWQKIHECLKDKKCDKSSLKYPLSKIETNKSIIKLLKKMAVKLSVQEKILDSYERDIDDYREFLEKLRRD